jgi:hypothetical protein
MSRVINQLCGGREASTFSSGRMDAESSARTEHRGSALFC